MEKNDEPIVMSKNELRKAIEEQVKPLEEAAYAKGKRDGEAEGREKLREAAMIQIARVRGLLPAVDSATGKPTTAPTPADLGRRANQLQVAALQEGRELSNIEAVQAAYTE